MGEKFCYTALAACEIDHAVIRRVVAHIEGVDCYSEGLLRQVREGQEGLLSEISQSNFL